MRPPFLTTSQAPIACEYKLRPSDFHVEEVAAYEPSGSGQHLWFQLEKCGMTTDAALAELGRCFGTRPRFFGVGGKKDARAVTVQWVSLDRPPADAESRLSRFNKSHEESGPSESFLRVTKVTRHRNRLGIGHTHGNRFRIRLRGMADQDHEGTREVLAEVERRGAPNYFGEQRFGHRGDTADVGAAILSGRCLEAVQLILGRPTDADTGRWREAREAFESGDLARAMQAWPRNDRTPGLLLKSLMDAGGRIEESTASAALQALDRRDLLFFGSAFQARLFNRVLAGRVDTIEEVWQGDLALRLPGGRKSFPVEDLAAEQVRAANLEITASGPLFGRKMPWPSGRAADLELAALCAEGWTREGFDSPHADRWDGGRRPLRIPIQEASTCAGDDTFGPYFELRFRLPKGCYATSVLREIHKSE